jgi:hypothetical protein
MNDKKKRLGSDGAYQRFILLEKKKRNLNIEINI